ncbi:MAG: cell division protein ZapA, partial [candidate division NC10 bacterium]|nr:cell division protein ZapA [candidate division NC10 bacterium]
EVAKSSPTLSTGKMAILSSLNIADELIRLEEEKEKSEKSILSKVGELISLMDQEMEAVP